MIGVIDYGMGNLYSVSKALERLQQPYVVSESPEELKKADGLILPGVGAFKDAIKALNESGLYTFVKNAVADDVPLFGICLGMQLLFEESEENGLTKGFGFLPGRVERFSGKTTAGVRYKVPHMGWNELRFHAPDHPLLKKVDESYVYFVHSYVVNTSDPNVVLASSDYDVEVPAVVGQGNVMGVQFHPEKSSTLGMEILQNYCGQLKGRYGDE